MMAEVEGKLAAAGFKTELMSDEEHGLVGDRDLAAEPCSDTL